jgi:transposase
MQNETHAPATVYHGIDVGKDKLAVARLLRDGSYELKEFDNNERGINALLAHLKGQEAVFVTMEATGSYSMKALCGLCEAQVPVALINPKQGKGFINGVMLSTTKTDQKDACGLALYGQVNKPPAYEMPSHKLLEIRQLRVLLKQLKKQQGIILNQLHALGYHASPLGLAKEVHEKNLSSFKDQIKEVEKRLCSISKEHFEKLYELALTIKGIGPATAMALLVLTDGCRGFKGPKQLAKFIGICPTQHESGTSVKGKGTISRTGEPGARALLYMGARSAKLHNLACKDLYERLRSKGKCHKVALVAVCHKLLRQFFAVVTKQEPFDNEWHLKTKKV